MSRAKNKTNKRKISVGLIFKIIFFVITIPLLIISGTIMYKANKYPDKIPDVFGIKPMIVLSGSMESTIYTGDLVFVKMVDVANIEINDIIAFRNEEDKVTTHRVIEIITEDGEVFYKTKGDNNSVEDANLVKTSSIEGKYISRIPNLGNFLMFMQQPIGLATVLMAILIIGMVWLYIINKIDDKKYAEEDKKYKEEFEEFKRRKQEENND